MVQKGKLIREVLIPGRYARAFEVNKGQLLQIIDVEGQQVADFFAFSKDNHEENFLLPTPGLPFFHFPSKWGINFDPAFGTQCSR